MTRAAVARGCALALAIGAIVPTWTRGAEATCRAQKVTISWRDPGVGATIRGTAGADVIQGGPGNETILGGGGDDVICGGGGRDTIDGGPGRDELSGGGGNDTFQGADVAQDIVVGGDGIGDTADYSASPVAVRVDMPAHVVLGAGSTTRGGIQSIERVIGSPHDDTLLGNRTDNRIHGGGGDDYVDGGGGSDLLVGGAGNDIVSFKSAVGAIEVHGTRVLIDENPHDAEVFAVGFTTVIGSDHDDEFYATDDNDHFVGGDGNDTLRGGKGDDILEGGAGDDELYPGPGDDYVDGGTNSPVTNQHHPGDLVSYSGDEVNTGDVQFEAYLTSDRFGNPPGTPSVGNDVFANIESVRGVKDKTNIITGDDGPNVLIGGGRTDELIGAGGDDLLFGLASPDSLNGDAGNDFLDGGSPTGPSDSDKLDGGDGDDTCLNSQPDYTLDCETTAR